MSNRMNFTGVMLIVASLLMLTIVLFTRYQLSAKQDAVRDGTAYEIRTKSGDIVLRGPELERSVAREQEWTLVFSGLIGLLLSCAVLALKREMPAALAAACFTLAAHGWLFYRLGAAEYSELNGLVFVISVLPFVPVAYNLYMRSIGLGGSPKPDGG